MNYIHKFIQLATAVMGDNPRLPNTLNIGPLAENIDGTGSLKEPITVWEIEPEIYQVIRGHRRTLACQSIFESNPKRFAEIFPDGIPAFVVEGVTAEEVVELKLDHTEQLGLSDPHEVQMSANMLFAIRRTEAEVAWQLSSLMEKVSPMKAKAKVALALLQEKLVDAKAGGKGKVIEACEKELRQFMADYRRGLVQGLHDVYRSPFVVNAALYAKASGEAPKGFEGIYLPKLTQANVKSLWAAHKLDLESKDEETGAPKYNQTRVGPNFTEKWNKLVADEQSGGTKEKVVQPKAMSAKDMIAEIGERWSSVAFCKLTNWHSGDKSVEGLNVLDKECYYMDLVRRQQPDLLDMVVAEGKKIEEALIVEDQTVKAKKEEAAA